MTKVAAARRDRQSSTTSNVYAHDGANMLSPVARLALPRIYVPNSQSNTVDVINPKTYKIVEQFAVGGLPQHVVPAWNLKTLYVTNDVGNSLTPIDPRTGKPGKEIPVADPYNMYFTPSGRYAIVVAERLARLDFRNPHTFRLHRSVDVPCRGVDHMDFSSDGSYLIASQYFSGQSPLLDVATESVVGVLNLPDGPAGMPQDVKLSPDGKVFYVADMHANGVWEIDGATLKVIGFLATGAGTHGLYPSRNAKFLYVTNRSEGSISVVSFATRKVVAKWRIPGGGSPDMGGRLRKRQGAVALGPLQRRRLRNLDNERSAAGKDPGRERSAWSLRLAATRPLLVGSHGDPPLALGCEPESPRRSSANRSGCRSQSSTEHGAQERSRPGWGSGERADAELAAGPTRRTVSTRRRSPRRRRQHAAEKRSLSGPSIACLHSVHHHDRHLCAELSWLRPAGTVFGALQVTFGTRRRPVCRPRLRSRYFDRRSPDERKNLMDLYAIIRREGWVSPGDLQEAAARSAAVGDTEMPADIRWIRSYVLGEESGKLGTVCIYEASSPEKIREHAQRADLPVTEIISIADTVIVRPDPSPAA